ncbi:MAG: hypothetical protein R6U32_03040 [Candidatus Woesearchaeota archaeon]
MSPNKETGRKIKEVANFYMTASSEFRAKTGYLCMEDTDNIGQLVAMLKKRMGEDGFDEERMRTIESSLHNAESKYDNYFRGLNSKRTNKELKDLREHVASARNLAETARSTIHFLQRHHGKIDNMVDHDAPFRTLADTLKGMHNYFMEGEKYIYGLLPKHKTSRIDEAEGKYDYKLTVVVENNIGIHMRTCTGIAKIHTYHGKPETLFGKRGEEPIPLGSMLSMLSFAAKKGNIMEFYGGMDCLKMFEDIDHYFYMHCGEDGYELNDRVTKIINNSPSPLKGKDETKA